MLRRSLGPLGWTTFGQGDEGALALDTLGVPHIAYTRVVSGIRRVAYANKIGGSWSSPIQIDDASFGVNQGSWHPTLAFYPDGNLLLAWYVGSFNYVPDGTIYFRTRSHLDGSWGARTTITGDTLMTSIDNGPSLLITIDGTAHVTFLSAGPAGEEAARLVTTFTLTTTPDLAGLPIIREAARRSLTTQASAPARTAPSGIYGHGWQGGSIEGHGNDLYYFEGGVDSWGPWTIYASGAFDSSVSTRWAQFFQRSRNTRRCLLGRRVSKCRPRRDGRTQQYNSYSYSYSHSHSYSHGAGTCGVRPRVSLTTSAIGAGQPRHHLGANFDDHADQRLASIRVTGSTNAAVRVNGTTATVGSTTTLAAGTQQATLLVTRQSPAQNPSLPSTVAFVVTDNCGGWSTLVGGGPTAF